MGDKLVFENYEGRQEYYKKTVIDKIKSYIQGYKDSCKIEGVCLDDRLCSTCFYGGAVELGDEILDVIKEADGE